MKRHQIICWVSLVLGFSSPILSQEAAPNEEPSLKILSFSEAACRTVDNALELRISSRDIEERKGARIQSQSFPNPVAAYSVEDVFGNKSWKGWKSAESRYELDQLIELGGKRGYRMQYAAFLESAAKAGYEAKKLSLLNSLAKAFIDAAAAEEKCTLLEEGEQSAEQVLKTASSKIMEGKGSIMQKNKAEIVLSASRIQLQKAKLELIKAKERLCFLWGATAPDFDRVEYPFYDLTPPTNFESCKESLKCHPLLVKAQMKHLAAEQNCKLEKAEAVPDVTVMVGYKTENEHNERGMVFGAALPIPVFDQNKGNIMRAKAELKKASELYLELYRKMENKLSHSFRDLAQAYNEAKLLRDTVLKAAEQSFEYAQTGFQEGKFEYLEVLDAHRTLVDIKEQYIQALLIYHRCRADIEYLFSQEYEP